MQHNIIAQCTTRGASPFDACLGFLPKDALAILGTIFEAALMKEAIVHGQVIRVINHICKTHDHFSWSFAEESTKVWGPT